MLLISSLTQIVYFIDLGNHSFFYVHSLIIPHNNTPVETTLNYYSIGIGLSEKGDRKFLSERGKLSNLVELQVQMRRKSIYNNLNKKYMLQSIPTEFTLAQFIESAILQQMQFEEKILKAPISFNKKQEEVFAIAMSSRYLAFGIIQTNDIAFVCYIPLINDIRLQKLFRNQQPNSQIIGFKLTYQKQELQIYFRNKKCIEEWIEKLAKKITQTGFHQQFRPIRKLGKGGFATVYEVKRALDGKTFAVKAFSKAHAFSSPSNKATLENEIEILKMIHHENLLCLYEVFESQNSLYLVMQEYNGGDLVTLIRRSNAIFTPQEIQSFMYDLLKGLAELQRLQIMHRDIKPENVMVRNRQNSKQLVIVDFGLASRTDIPKYLLQRCGTPGYVAPEIANFKSGQRLTSRCDMFSLGVVFHILLCRTHLFNGNNCDEVYMKNKKLDFDLNHPKYQVIDQNALALMKGMLEADPTKRISASQAMQHQYFWDMISEFQKRVDTPLTLGTSSKQMSDEMLQDYGPIRQKLNFEMRG